MLKNRSAYLYLFPSFIFIVFIFLFPIFKIIQYGLADNNSDNVLKISLRSFKILFIDNVFLLALKNNFILFSAIPILLIVSIFIAILLFEKIRGWRFYRFIIFLPYILSIVVVGVCFSIMLQRNGIINTILERIGLGRIALDWLGSPKIAIYVVLFVIIWKTLGFGVVIFNSRLLSINVEVLEAAELDGANWFQKHVHITIPELRGVMEFYLVLTVINMLSWVFGYIFVMTYGGPGMSTVVTEYYIYSQLFKYNHLNLASSATIFMLIFTFILVFFQLRISKSK